MPPPFEDPGPDHPLFTRGVSFVFRSDLPAEQEHKDEPESEDDDDDDDDIADEP
jgi:hypothetical protein